MKQFSDEQVMAFADGELDDATRTDLAAALSTDAVLAARVARHRALRETVFAGFSDILDAPIPARLQQAANGPQHPIRRLGAVADGVASAPAAQHPLRSPRGSRRWEALAAMLMVGIAAGAIGSNAFNLFNRGDSSAPIATTGTGMIAQHQLADALSRQLASTQPANAPTKVGLSFRDTEGRFCRSFTMTTVSVQRGELAGLACRNADQDWQIALLMQGTAAIATTENYRTAGSQTPSPILQEIDRRIRGTPLDAAGERAAASSHWR